LNVKNENELIELVVVALFRWKLTSMHQTKNGNCFVSACPKLGNVEKVMQTVVSRKG